MVQYTWGWVTATCRRDWTAGPSEIWSPTSKMYGSNYEAPRPLGADLCTLFVGQYPKSFVWKESLVFFVFMLLAHTVKTIQRNRQTDRRADWLTDWLTDWLIDWFDITIRFYSHQHDVFVFFWGYLGFAPDPKSQLLRRRPKSWWKLCCWEAQHQPVTGDPRDPRDLSDGGDPWWSTIFLIKVIN